MSIAIQTPGVHHVSLRSADLERSKRFYTQTLGFPIIVDEPKRFVFLAGKTPVGVCGPAADSPRDDKFNPLRVGLDHLALGCESDAEMERVALALTGAGIENTGIKFDDVLGKRYVAFKDPDRISWEFYGT